jgi:phosphoglycerate dehydrogenase-like enzyme
MNKPKVILDPHFRRINTIFKPEDRARLHAAADVVWARDEAMPPREIDQVREEVVAIISSSWRHGNLDDFPNLRAFIEVSGSFPSPAHLDYQTCFARNIRILSCAPAFGPAVAEMALALALACARQLAWADAAFRHGEPNWSHTEHKTELGIPYTLFGKQVGLIGFGGLAKALMPLLEPFGTPVQVYDPWLSDTFLRTQQVTPVGLDTLLSTSRLIFVLALPSESNRKMLDREKLALIQPNATLLLMSRAHVVDFEALTELLAAGRFQAGIDVFPEEPLPKDHPIRQLSHAVLSPHRAGSIPDALFEIGRLVANDIEAVTQGLVPQSLQVAQPEFIKMRSDL